MIPARTLSAGKLRRESSERRRGRVPRATDLTGRRASTAMSRRRSPTINAPCVHAHDCLQWKPSTLRRRAPTPAGQTVIDCIAGSAGNASPEDSSEFPATLSEGPETRAMCFVRSLPAARGRSRQRCDQSPGQGCGLSGRPRRAAVSQTAAECSLAVTACRAG